jgi:hypothetical protein
MFAFKYSWVRRGLGANVVFRGYGSQRFQSWGLLLV